MSREVVRLERGEDKARVFWEITRDRAKITTRFGRWLSAGRRVEKTSASEAEAKKTCAALVSEKRKAGYADPPRKLAPGGASEKGHSARNPEMEALIDADPGDPEGYLVYADWLQQQRDVRGELVMVQHGLGLDPDDAALVRAETELFKVFEKDLFGPLMPYRHIRTSLYSLVGLSWRFGFLRAARLRRTTAPIETAVRLLLEHPSGRFLEKLVLGAGTDLALVMPVIAEVAPKTLRELVLGDGLVHVGVLDAVWEAMPGLRSLALDGFNVAFGTVRAGALEELVVGRAERTELEAVARAEWPRLERLSVFLQMPIADCPGSLAPIFESRGLPRLRELTVERWITAERSERPIAHDELAIETLAFAAKRKLERVELQMPLAAAGVEKVMADRAFSKIGKIALVIEGVGRPLRAPLLQRCPNVELVPRNDRALGEISDA